MSAALVRKSLALVESDNLDRGGKRKKSAKLPSQLLPGNRRLVKDIKQKGRKVKKEVFTSSSKVTILNVPQHSQLRKDTLQENLRKIKLLDQVCKIELDRHVTKHLFQRARSRKPVAIEDPKKSQNTAFTEEDFKKFEEEYVDE